MMRQIFALVLMLALAPLAHGNSTRHRKLDELRTTQDKLDELNSDNALEDDKPKREVVRVPAGTYNLQNVKPKPAAQPVVRVPASRGPASVTGQQPRTPASVQPMQMLAKPASPLPTAAAITFDEYMADNARNPALSKAIPDHQLAFQDTSGIATIPLENSTNGTGNAANGATGAAAAPGAAGAAAGGNAGAIQAAAAAAAAAGLIPAGTALPGGTTAPAGGAANGGPLR